MNSKNNSSENKSWPWGIALFYTFFVLALLGAWYFSSLHKPDLVEKDYYRQSIRYQKTIDAINNTRALKEPPVIQYDTQQHNLLVKLPQTFQKKSVSGTLHFFRPSDSGLDFSKPFQPDSSGRMIVPIPQLYKGKWKVRLYWRADSTHYYFEKILVI
ncbi:MAG: hypothetical protein D6677_03075 [Calditrichaeota bacterium]|nr:MAG: hypothetical protein D6677_03075 [Calditrichota bacterium]